MHADTLCHASAPGSWDLLQRPCTSTSSPAAPPGPAPPATMASDDRCTSASSNGGTETRRLPREALLWPSPRVHSGGRAPRPGPAQAQRFYLHFQSLLPRRLPQRTRTRQRDASAPHDAEPGGCVRDRRRGLRWGPLPAAPQGVHEAATTGPPIPARPCATTGWTRPGPRLWEAGSAKAASKRRRR